MSNLSDNRETQIRIVERASSTLPQTAQTAYFTVTGKIRLISIVGEVTVAIENNAINARLVSNPTVGADVDLCVDALITNDAIGTIYTITGTLANALVPTTSGAVQHQANEVLVTAGTIDLITDANRTGETKWVLQYIPIDRGARVTAA